MKFASVVVIVAAVVGARADDECMPMPPKPGEKHVHASECCKLDGVGGVFVDGLKSGVQKCQEKFPPPPRPPRPPGPPPPGGPPPEVKNHHACMVECVFTEAGMVKDGKLSKEAAMKSFTSDNKEVTTAITAALDKCFASYEKDIDPSLECTSGAMEMEKCAMREVFLNCPASMWSDSAECGALKTKIEKCPRMPVMMGPHGPPRPKPN